MKHIIIAGAPRSGKTTLSRSVHMYYKNPIYTHYKMDSIKRATFDILGLKNKDWHFASTFVAEMIKRICSDNEQESSDPEFFIFDTPHLYPDDLAKFPKSKFLIIFLGYTDISAKEKAIQILEHDSPNCWTKKVSNERLMELVNGNIAFSEEIKAQCSNHDMLYFDTSKNIHTILHSAFNSIIELNQ